MIAVERENNIFKKAVIFSVSAHVFLFIFILISPYLPKSSKTMKLSPKQKSLKESVSAT
jgi:hypothetical protein